MSGVLIHDGRRPGQRKWSVEAIEDAKADGVIVSPFATPRVSEPRHPSGHDVVQAVRAVGGETVFDAMTHARLLPGANKLDLYDSWELWGPAGIGLDTAARRVGHIERVFDRQRSLAVPAFAPTLRLETPDSPESDQALATARIARGIDSDTWQSLVGTRRFWAAETRLDAYVGSLVALGAPVWVLTVANDLVVDHVPDLTDAAAFVGLCRTVHSLSLRSRVIVAHADFAGLPAVAAGADTVGSGWDRGQRTFDPLTFRLDSEPGVRRPAAYVTQGRLSAVLRRDTAQTIERWDAAHARTIRGGPMPRSDHDQRMHHLRRLRAAVRSIDSDPDRATRIATLRDRYEVGSELFDELIAEPGVAVRPKDKELWNRLPRVVLDEYAAGEGY